MTDTPKTDAMCERQPTHSFWWPAFARTLERELAAERAALPPILAELERAFCEVVAERDELRSQNIKLARERHELRQQLEQMTGRVICCPEPPLVDWWCTVCREMFRWPYQPKPHTPAIPCPLCKGNQTYEANFA